MQAGWEQLLCQPTPTLTLTLTLPPPQVEDGWEQLLCGLPSWLDGTDDSIDEAIRQLIRDAAGGCAVAISLGVAAP